MQKFTVILPEKGAGFTITDKNIPFANDRSKRKQGNQHFDMKLIFDKSRLAIFLFKLALHSLGHHTHSLPSNNPNPRAKAD